MKKILLCLTFLSLILPKVKAQKIDFTGPGNSVQTTYDLDLVNGFTIEYWVYLNSLQDWNGTVTQTVGNLPAPIDVYINGGGTLGVLYGNGSSVVASGSSSMLLSAGQWYHIAHTYDPSANNGLLYVNDSLVYTFAIAASSLANASNHILYLGTRDDDATNANIMMKDLKVWSGARTPTLSTCLTGTETGLQVYYKMDEGTGTTLTDLATADGSNDGNFFGNITWQGLQAPTVTVSPSAPVILSGTNETFSATISGDIFNPEFQWYKNNVAVGTDSINYSTTTLTSSDSVYVQVSSSVPCLLTPAITTGKINVTVKTLPSNSIAYPSGSPCFSAGNLTFCDALSYNWGNFYYDQNNIGGSDISTITINSTGQQESDGFLEVAVNDTAFTHVPGVAYVDTLNHVVQSGTQAISGLNVSKEFRFFENQPIVRLNVQLNNPTPSPITVKVDVGSIFASYYSTILDSSSTGGASATDNDRWIITSDQNTFPNNKPVITTVRFGSGTIQAQPHFNSAPDVSHGYYDDSVIVTVPANSNKYFVLFNRIDSIVETAKANVSYFDNTKTMMSDSLFAGIDRTNIVNWALCTNSVSVLTITACNSFVWQGTTYTSSGTYHDTIPNAAGCDSIMTLNLTINLNPDATTSVTDPTITANASGASYQWIDCDNGNAVIAGETNQAFTATQNGNYAVIVTQNGCTDTSACVNINSIIVTGINSGTIDALTVSPNPGSGIFTINASAGYTLSVLSVIGEEKLTQICNLGANTLDLSTYPNGVYFLNIRTDATNRTIKLIKE
jgi:hypothetical protein